ncbi:TetR/AcrR family transcriptional regulator [Salipaludibacillus daqingensis]|uniref:TetR/AcrR family transcriptional regulator n=1 Tax=Salipaludibacillus daqingensis TaxID=3041001 RepID=UPI002476365A|nr:TetR/AcrR family transcriptional regulator [Salipaludibacillus daqingensis]
MKDKKDQIIHAAIEVFIRKGLQATTQELANEANVAEVTLYRKFGNKQQLFVTVLKSVIENKFSSQLMKQAKTSDSQKFLRELIDNRLDVLSRHQALVKMLISESLMGHLPPEIDLPEIIFATLKEGIVLHAEHKEQTIDAETLARQLSGIFLSHLILPSSKAYHELSEEEKNLLLDRYVSSMIGNI